MRAKAVEPLRYFAFSVELLLKNLRNPRPKEGMGRFPPPGELKLPTGSNTSTQGVDGYQYVKLRPKAVEPLRYFAFSVEL